MKYILNMCLIHLQSIKMKNRICFKYCLGICLMQYVWNMLNIILEVIETFHTHSTIQPCTLYVYIACALGTNSAPGTEAECPGEGPGRCARLAFPCPQRCSGPLRSPKEPSFPFSSTPSTPPGGPHAIALPASLSFIFAK